MKHKHRRSGPNPLREYRRLIRQLDDAHTSLLRVLRDGGRLPHEE